MSKKIILTVGLQGSGKTTWSREQVAKSNGNLVNINKDDLRLMFADTKAREKLVLKFRDELTKLALSEGKSVIISDTNFNPIHEARMREIAKEYNAIVEINDSFLEVPLEVCIKRDKQRQNPVGEKVIRDTYNRFIKKEYQPRQNNLSLLPVTIVDIDGTVAIMGNNRSPYDWSKVGLDTPNNDVLNIIKVLAVGTTIIFMSGRDEVCREETIKWLNQHTNFEYKLFMRAEGDVRKDSTVKEEIYNREIKDKYFVTAVFDDRLQVCRLWHKLGLPLFRVGDPDSNF